MATVGLVGVGMDVVDGMYANKAKGVGRTSGDAGAFAKCEVIH